MTELPPESGKHSIAREQAFEADRRRLIPEPVLAILVVGSLVSLVVASLPFLSEAASGALRGVAFTCLGLIGTAFFAHTWWHRQPLKIKGGLSPDRPFFYHLGTAVFFGTSLLLALAGASLIQRWLGV
jgi:hypothetical protein